LPTGPLLIRARGLGAGMEAAGVNEGWLTRLPCGAIVRFPAPSAMGDAVPGACRAPLAPGKSTMTVLE
jgi:hypothetical protein